MTQPGASLTALLTRAGLERLLPRFEEEDLTMPLLISMGTQLRANLADLDLTPDEITAVVEALLHRAEPSADGAGPPGCYSATILETGGVSCQQATVLPDPLAGFHQCVAGLQLELFADDLEPPAGAHLWRIDQLRTYYESGGKSTPCGSLDQDMQPCSGGLYLSVEAAEEEEPVVVTGLVVGTLHLRWQAHRADFDFAADTTVGALKRWLHQRTGVPPARQRLLGLARRGEAAEEAPPRELTLAPALPILTSPPTTHPLPLARCCWASSASPPAAR